VPVAVEDGRRAGLAAQLRRDPVALLLHGLVLGQNRGALGVRGRHRLLLLVDQRDDLGLVLLGGGLGGGEGGPGARRGRVGGLPGQRRLVLGGAGGQPGPEETLQGPLLALRGLVQVIQPVDQISRGTRFQERIEGEPDGGRHGPAATVCAAGPVPLLIS
jgi:hypothetical protein